MASSPFKSLFTKQCDTTPDRCYHDPSPNFCLTSKKSQLDHPKPKTITPKQQQQEQQLPTRLSKRSTAVTLKAEQDGYRLPFGLSLMTPSPNSSSTFPPTSMFLPPAALFPALSAQAKISDTSSSSLASTGELKKQKAGLFSKISKQKKRLQEDHYPTNVTNTRETTGQGQKGAWSGSTFLLRRDNNVAHPFSTSPQQQKVAQTATAAVTRKKAGTSQSGQMWKSKVASIMSPISIQPTNDNGNSQAITVIKKPNWLSIPSLTSVNSASSSPYISCQEQDQQAQNQSQHHQYTLLQRQRSRPGVTFAVQDVFGIGKMSEMIVALFLAHDSFLSRKPLWLQCAIMLWEGAVVFIGLWAILRVIGLAEVIVWGADDILRGTVSIVQAFAHALRILLWR